jgi:hypothetical protein
MQLVQDGSYNCVSISPLSARRVYGLTCTSTLSERSHIPRVAAKLLDVFLNPHQRTLLVSQAVVPWVSSVQELLRHQIPKNTKTITAIWSATGTQTP